jgi:hypothetical protein
VNILLWILQVLLALHTVMGAVWKFSNSPEAVPSLKAIPHGVWLAISALEVIWSVCLILPAFYQPKHKLGSKAVPIAALCIGAVMLVYCGFHLASGDPNHGQMVYWIVVMALCMFIAYGRLKLKPL